VILFLKWLILSKKIKKTTKKGIPKEERIVTNPE
jgi:hypothetical protein